MTSFIPIIQKPGQIRSFTFVLQFDSTIHHNPLLRHPFDFNCIKRDNSVNSIIDFFCTLKIDVPIDAYEYKRDHIATYVYLFPIVRLNTAYTK